MKKAGLLVVVLLFLHSFADGQVTQPNTSTAFQDAWKLLDKADYSIQYPANWNLDTSGRMDLSFIMSPNQIKDLFFSVNFRLQLRIGDLAGQIISLDTIAKMEEQRFKNEELTNGRILESKRSIANGMDFHKIIYTLEYKNVMCKGVQYIWIQPGKVYLLGFGGEDDQYNNYWELGEKILGTFRLK